MNMIPGNGLTSLLFTFVLFFSFAGNTLAVPDVDAPRISLKLSCEAGNDNCFDTDLATTDNRSITDMLDWIWVTRVPTIASPLIVDIDPGTFTLPDTLFCNGQGNVTLHGSGVDNTVLTGGGTSLSTAVITIDNCTNLSFQDFTIQSGKRNNGSGSDIGVQWMGNGNSNWTNIQIQANIYGWENKNCTDSTHYWFSSKLDVVPVGNSNVTLTYNTSCGNTWFYSGKLQAINDGESTTGLLGVSASGDTNVHIFGTVVRVHTTAATTQATSPFFGHGGLVAAGNAKVSIHGSLISVTSDANVDQSVYGVRAGINNFTGGGFIHAPGTAYSLKASGNGIVERVSVKNGTILGVVPDGIVDAPFQWPKSDTPPAITSTNGSDTFVEADCDNTGNCNTAAEADKRPHMMIYTDKCLPDSTWFNSTLGQCRGPL